MTTEAEAGVNRHKPAGAGSHRELEEEETLAGKQKRT